MNQNTLNQVLENHKHWLCEDYEGWKSMKADLREANLRYANLRHANLRYANLREANLRHANLREADLWGADLREADLRYANLREADLWGANIRGANIRGAEGTWFPLSCPSDGEFVAWKKARRHGKHGGECMVKLLITADAKRLSATTEKCRTDKAIVLEIYDMDGEVIDECAYSSHDKSFEYKKGKVVVPKEPFNEDRWDECSSGIHFFIDREMAKRY